MDRNAALTTKEDLISMTTVYFDAPFTDEVRRKNLFEGNLFAFSPRASTTALVTFARELIEEAFAPRDPQLAQFEMPVEEFAAILSELKPRFIHHPRSKELLRAMLEDFGCDLDRTFFDVPKMRSMASDDYLKAGIALQFDLHRDSWFASPLCQQNWWMPIYDVSPDNAMTFYPRYFKEPVKNGSSRYNQYEWNKTGRAQASTFIKNDPRDIPKPEQDMDLSQEIRLITRAGAPIMFSGAQMHATVPNTAGRTRFSIDFRTVHLDDIVNKSGAPNVDSAPTGTTLFELLSARDFSHMDESVIRMYDPNPPAEGLVFEPAGFAAATENN
jgi:hypothetical protein